MTNRFKVGLIGAAVLVALSIVVWSGGADVVRERARDMVTPAALTIPPGRYAAFAQKKERAEKPTARAQFYIGQVARRCELELTLYERIGVLPEENCVGFQSAHPWSYWNDAALKAKDPLAVLTDVVERQLTGTAAPGELDAAITNAILSKDREVLLGLGFAMLNPEVHPDPVDGLAWLIVACGDCLTDDPRIGLGCAQVGSCAYGITLSQWLSDTFPEHIAEAEDRAASLRLAMR